MLKFGISILRNESDSDLIKLRNLRLPCSTLHIHMLSLRKTQAYSVDGSLFIYSFIICVEGSMEWTSSSRILASPSLYSDWSLIFSSLFPAFQLLRFIWIMMLFCLTWTLMHGWNKPWSAPWCYKFSDWLQTFLLGPCSKHMDIHYQDNRVSSQVFSGWAEPDIGED